MIIEYKHLLANKLKGGVHLLLLVCVIVFGVSAYAAEAELAEVATALGVNSEAEASESGDSSTADAQPKPPVIMGESTNNAEIETKPTPKKIMTFVSVSKGYFLRLMVCKRLVSA